MRELSLIILKPDCLKRNLEQEILNRILNLKANIVKQFKWIANRELLKTHYWEIWGLKEKLTSKKLNQIIDFMASWEIEVYVLEGDEGLVKSIRKTIWTTEPLSANPWTIRGDYSYDSYELAEKENRSLENLIHASANKEEALKEINLWFPN